MHEQLNHQLPLPARRPLPVSCWPINCTSAHVFLPSPCILFHHHSEVNAPARLQERLRYWREITCAISLCGKYRFYSHRYAPCYLHNLTVNTVTPILQSVYHHSTYTIVLIGVENWAIFSSHRYVILTQGFTFMQRSDSDFDHRFMYSWINQACIVWVPGSTMDGCTYCP